MRTKNLHDLPKVRDRLSYLYVEHCRIDQEAKAIAVHNVDGMTAVPCANLSVLMLGPGTNITHAAVLALADNGCLAVWCGEGGVRFYSAGQGTTRSAANLLHQANLCSHLRTRLLVVRRMYAMRFEDPLPDSLTLQQIRGKEGARVRDGYARMAAETGVPWAGRNYNREDWKGADPINRALSTANSCLYGICHAAIVAAGYAPGIGFVHTGNQLSFVFDIADLYKVELTVPAAFRAAATITKNLEREVRQGCRDAFSKGRLLERIVRDIDKLLDIPVEDEIDSGAEDDADSENPGGLWDPDAGSVPGGENYAPAPDEEEGPKP